MYLFLHIYCLTLSLGGFKYVSWEVTGVDLDEEEEDLAIEQEEEDEEEAEEVSCAFNLLNIAINPVLSDYWYSRR